MGYHRQPQPAPPPIVISLNDAIEQRLAELLAEELLPPDPFNVANPCPHNAGGPHEAFPSCGDLVCRHCSTVFW